MLESTPAFNYISLVAKKFYERAPILVPVDAHHPLDGYELNLFAAKLDRVGALLRQGFLVDEFPAWVPSADNCKIADAFWRGQKFAPLINLPDGK